DDIVVDQPSATWLSDEIPTDRVETHDMEMFETAPQADTFEDEIPSEPTKSRVALFGEFEDEEEIAVGEAFRGASSALETLTNLEEILHQEIVGINPFPEHGEDFEPQPTSANSGDSSSESAAYEHEINEVLSLRHDSSPEPADEIPNSDEQQQEERASLLRIAAEETMDCDQATPGADDTDILVIEEEIEVRRVDRPVGMTEAQPALSIDYQQMLSRMRSGS
ncbi:MAG: hypothetical protein ACR2NZ_01435, partial [Rubripirellula sp.]